MWDVLVVGAGPAGSAAAIDPLAGDGMAMALRSGELASKALIDGLSEEDPHRANRGAFQKKGKY